MNLLADIQGAQIQDTTTQAAIVTSIGLIIVALIGVITARVTFGNQRRASISADAAQGYAEAIKAKDELISSLEERLKIVEARLDECERREHAHQTRRRRGAKVEPEEES